MELVVKNQLITHTVVNDQSWGTRSRQEVHPPGGRRHSSREIHFSKRVVHRLATKKEEPMQDHVRIHVAVNIGNIQVVLVAKDVEGLERKDATKDSHLRMLQSHTGVFRLDLDTQVTARHLGNLADLELLVQLFEHTVTVIRTSE